MAEFSSHWDTSRSRSRSSSRTRRSLSGWFSSSWEPGCSSQISRRSSASSIPRAALVAPLITGYLGERVGWHLGFGAAGVGMVIGLITYRLRADKTLGSIGVVPGSTDPAEHRRVRLTAMIGVAVIALVVVLTMAGIIHVNPVSLAGKITVIIVGSALVYFIYLFVGGGLTTEEKKRA